MDRRFQHPLGFDGLGKMKTHASARLLALLSIVTLGSTNGAEVELRLQADARQEIRGWGFTPAPIDWDGNSMLRDTSILVRVFKDSGVNMARVLIGDLNMYDVVALKPRFNSVDSYILPQIVALQKAGIDKYVLSLMSAPVFTKAYNAPHAYIEMDPNYLREECGDLVAGFLVDVVRRLREHNVPMPVAISIQSQPNGATFDYGCPPATAHGTFYTPEQWMTVARKTRQLLDGAGLGGVGIIGPESFGLGWGLAPACQEMNEALERRTKPAFTGVAFNLPGDFRTQEYAAQIRMIERHFEERWMLTPYLVNSGNDRQLLLESFVAVQRDLLELGVTHWFWRFGFTWERGAESLTYGRAGTETPVFAALKILWHTAPAGSKISALTATGNTVANLRTIGFRNGSETTVVAINLDGYPHKVRFLGIPQSSGVAHRFDGETPFELLKLSKEGDSFEVESPPRTVVIAHFR